MLRVEYDGAHRLADLAGGGRTERLDSYPGELCKAVLRGLANQIKQGGRHHCALKSDDVDIDDKVAP